MNRGIQYCIVGKIVSCPFIALGFHRERKRDAHLGEKDVNGRREEDWCDCNANYMDWSDLSNHRDEESGAIFTNLHHEACKVERILIKQDSATITDHLSNTSSDHAGRKPYRSPFDPFGDLDDHADTKEGDPSGIEAQNRSVIQDAGTERAKSKGAISIGSIGDEAVWKRHVWFGLNFYHVDMDRG